jgi:1-aminocyclopropane-1-carboxylate deaminase
MNLRQRCLDLHRRLGLPPSWARWHPLRSFAAPTWLLREDELGGTKRRKYRSLVPALIARGLTSVRLRGSPHSNHLLQLSLLLKEAGIEPVYHQEGRPGPVRGNGLWNRLILGANYRLDEAGDHTYEIPEGAVTREALPGAITLSTSVARALARTGASHVAIDAGTGFSALGLLLGLTHLYRGRPKPRLSVLWLGGRVCPWEHLVAEWSPVAAEWLELDEPIMAEVSRPASAASFGAVNAGVLDEIVRTAREEGVLLDPLYTAKLFQEARRRQWPEGTLLIHSGGQAALSGFEERLAARI